jgi:hypothetical protein
MSLSEHKKFQDYLMGNQQMSEADKKRKQHIEDELELFNKWKALFEEISQIVHDTILPIFKDISQRAFEIAESVKPWVSSITKAGLALMGLIASMKVLIGLASGYNLIKSALGLGGMGGPGIAGGLRAGGVGGLLRGAGGTIVGAGAGMAVTAGYNQLTGRDLDNDPSGSATAYAGSVGRAGARIAAGTAVGGPLGGIGAGIYGIWEDGKQSIKIWNDIKDIQSQTRDINIKNLEASKEIASLAKTKWGNVAEAAAVKGDKELGAYAQGQQKVNAIVARQAELESKMGINAKFKADGNEDQMSYINSTTWGGYTTDEEDKMADEYRRNKQEIKRIQQSELYNKGQSKFNSTSEADKKKMQAAQAMVASVESGPDEVSFTRRLAAQRGARTGTNADIRDMLSGNLNELEIKNQLGGKISDAAAKELGISSSTLSTSKLSATGLGYDELGAASQKIQGDSELSKKYAKELEAINGQLAERAKHAEDYSGAERIAGALINERNMSIASTNKLYEAQSGYVSAMISNFQATGNVDSNKLSAGIDKAMASMGQFVEQQKKSLELDEMLVKLDNQKADQQVAAAEKRIADLRKQREEATTQGKKNEIDMEIGSSQLEIDSLTKQKDLRISNLEATRGMVEKSTSLESSNARQLSLLQQMGTAYQGHVAYASALVSQAEIQAQLVDNMGAGFAASAQQRINIAQAIDDQVKAEQKNLAMIDQAIAKGKEYFMSAAGGGQTEEEAEKSVLALHTQKIQKQNEILNLKNKEAQTLKVLRDGYLSAVTAMTAGSGTWGKLIVDQNKNTGFAIKNLKILRSMGVGGMGSGADSRGARGISGFTTNGFTGPGDNNRPDFYDGGHAIADEVRERSDALHRGARQQDLLINRMRAPDGRINKGGAGALTGNETKPDTPGSPTAPGAPGAAGSPGSSGGSSNVPKGGKKGGVTINLRWDDIDKIAPLLRQYADSAVNEFVNPTSTSSNMQSYNT